MKIELITIYTITLLALNCSNTCHPTQVPPHQSIKDMDGIVDAGVMVDAREEQKETTAEPTTISNCSTNMVEIDGNYCTYLDQKCLEWRDNEQRVCLKFEPNYAKCLGREIHMHFCVDQYEIPNIQGHKPQLGMSFYDVENYCKSQNKRMGTDQEWTLMAEGNEHTPYPHAWERKEDWCSWDKAYIIPNEHALYQNGQIRDNEILRLDKSDPSGNHPNCYTQWGNNRVYDMQGNADEWTINISLGGKPYIGLLKGGYWSRGIRNRARPATEAHGPGFNGYEVGGRCFSNIY